MGMNSSNAFVISHKQKLDIEEETFIEVDNLVPDRNYTMHIIGASQYPGQPDFMNKSSIIKISFTTNITESVIN